MQKIISTERQIRKINSLESGINGNATIYDSKAFGECFTTIYGDAISIIDISEPVEAQNCSFTKQGSIELFDEIIVGMEECEKKSTDVGE